MLRGTGAPHRVGEGHAPHRAGAGVNTAGHNVEAPIAGDVEEVCVVDDV
ncbi:hypothetical protein GCM10009647_021830 [Streptomyces sanglieri]